MGETHVKEEIKVQDAKVVDEHKGSKDRVTAMQKKKKADLSDIILEKETGTQNKAKKMLLGLAGLILLFLLFLIFSRIINSTSSNNIVSEDNSSIIKTANIDDKTKEEEKNIPSLSKKDEKNSDLADTDLKFEEMVKKLREEDSKENGNEDIVKVIKPIKTTEEKSIKTVDKEKEKVSTSVKPIKIEEKEPKVIINEIKKPEVKRVPKVSQKKSHKVLIPSFASAKSGYYIQVGATTSPNPNRTLVSKIRANGYSYITYPIVVKGRRFYKVLIGPFSSRNAAGVEMDRVRSNINPKAFFYHIR